jgi:hypothetical protein
MSKAKVIKEAFRDAVVEFGFTGSGDTYRKALEEVIWTITLVKERGTRYSIGSGVWIKYLPGNEELLEEYELTEETFRFSFSHVRLKDTSKTRGKYSLEKILDSNTELDKDTLRDRIRHEIEQLVKLTLEKHLSTAVDCCKNVKALCVSGDGCFNMRDYCASLKQGIDTRVKPVRKQSKATKKKK